MTNKKTGTTTQTGKTEADPTQSKLNELYTAHQVHTLAHLIYQQIATRRIGSHPWTANGGTGRSSAMNSQPFTGGWTGSAQGTPQPLMYWYS